jgi:hypothetical protein
MSPDRRERQNQKAQISIIKSDPTGLYLLLHFAPYIHYKENLERFMASINTQNSITQ